MRLWPPWLDSYKANSMRLYGVRRFYLGPEPLNRDAGRSKLWGARCDHRKTSTSIYQKKAFYRALPLSSCAFNVCVSYDNFHFFPYKFQLNENAKALCLYCTDSKGTNICVKTIRWWYDFTYGEQAVSFKKVDLPESLLEKFGVPPHPYGELNMQYNRSVSYLLSCFD